MRILIGRFCHEGNGFSTQILNFEQFYRPGRWQHGEEVIRAHKGTTSYIGGMIETAEKHHVEVVPTVHCGGAAPTISRECVERTVAVILEDIRKAMESGLDAICLGLHGAGCVDGIEDLEAYTLQEIRKVVGPDMPICVPLDLHGNITVEMAKEAALFGIKQYPHLDCAEAGSLAMETCIEAVRTGKTPHCACVPLPMIIPATAGYTFEPPYTEFEAFFREYKREHNLIDISLFHGFMFCDRVTMGSSVTVVSWEDPEQHALKLAQYIWQQRNRLVARAYSAEESVRRAAASSAKGYVVISESSDNPGGGAPGDGTHLLRELLRFDLPGSIFGYIYDPKAVEQILQNQVGDTISVSIGGKTEPSHGEPVRLEQAEILAVSDGDYIAKSPMNPGQACSIGRCARLKSGNVEIIVGSKLLQVYDDCPFAVTGADLKDYRYVCLKSTHHFRAYFAERAGEIITCDSPGIHCCDLGAYEFHHRRRPMFPMEQEFSWNLCEDSTD